MGRITDRLPHPNQWDGERPLYSQAEAAIYLGIKEKTLHSRVYRNTIPPAAWSRLTGFCFTRTSLDKAKARADAATRANRTYRSGFPTAEQLVPQRLKRSTIDWNNPYEGRKK